MSPIDTVLDSAQALAEGIDADEMTMCEDAKAAVFVTVCESLRTRACAWV